MPSNVAVVTDEPPEICTCTASGPVTTDAAVGELAAQWAARGGRDNTAANRRSLTLNLGELADMPVWAVRASHIEDWQALLVAGRPWARRKPLAASSAAIMAGQLLSILQRARRDGLILAVPEPDVRTSPSDTAVRRGDLLTTDDVATLVAAARTPLPRSPSRPWLGRMVLVAAGSGLRVSELAGLRVRDVDFLRREIHVRAQADTAGREHADLKSEASARTVPVPQGVVDVLAEQLAASPRRPDETVWARDDGGMHNRGSVGRPLHRVIVQHKLRGATMHDLRHFYASALIAAGVPVTGVQAALGHASAATTLRVYAHLWPGAADVTRAAAAGAFALVRDGCGTGANHAAPDDADSAGQRRSEA
ncbi:tyrosine-type recombinase/integrase [Tomitella gaofuii]|uniref:tyrosine-type recombinase/integrase n=1 Tax=Tomitella gaofuii TaxID=2760083 RepID=UPI0015F7B6A6|nr:site-specific integrase [Tomitella gaofuii]